MSKYSQNMPPILQDAIGWMYPYMKPGSVLLDFGCSTGYFGSIIKRDKDCTVYGVEISKDVEEARKVLDGVYSFDLDGEWPQEIYERKYNYLFFGDVLEHLKDPAAVLRKCKKLLKKDGEIFVSVPNVAHISVRLELLQGNFEYEPMGILDNTHLKYFTLHSFTNMAAEGGYAAKLVDRTLNDYPTAVVTKLMGKAGVSPQPAFWKKADAIEARAYQFKFILKPLTAGVQPPKPLEKPYQSRDSFVDDLNVKVKNLSSHAEEQAKIIEHYKAQAERLQRENTVLKAKLDGSLAHRLKAAAKAAISSKPKKD